MNDCQKVDVNCRPLVTPHRDNQRAGNLNIMRGSLMINEIKEKHVDFCYKMQRSLPSMTLHVKTVHYGQPI